MKLRCCAEFKKLLFVSEDLEREEVDKCLYVCLLDRKVSRFWHGKDEWPPSIQDIYLHDTTLYCSITKAGSSLECMGLHR